MAFPIKHLVLKLDPFALGSTKRIIEELYLDMLQDVSNQKHLTKMFFEKVHERGKSAHEIFCSWKNIYPYGQNETI